MIRTRPLLAVAVVSLAALLAACPVTSKRAGAGDWNGTLTVVGDELWAPGQSFTVKAMVYPSPGLGEMLKAAGTSADKLVVLVTAERTFDADGWLRLPSDEGMSTLLTPTGIPVEGGNPGPVTERFGYYFHTPVDVLVEHDFTSWPQNFEIPITLPALLPPGLYRIRTDFGVRTRTGGYVDLSGYGMGSRPFLPRRGSYLYSGLHPASGVDARGRTIDAAQLQARLPWTLLSQYNSNGYSGVVADEDSTRFGLSSRNLIQDDVILPRYWAGSQGVVSYSLEPTLPADRIDSQSNLGWDFTKGELSLEITNPDGTVEAAGPTPIVGKTDDGGPTTRDPAFTDWHPPDYGRYTVKVTGWIADQAGRRYEGGGTYHFWIAKRMTMATATFQGNAYPVGFAYGRDMAFNPPLPADVTMDTRLYVGSDPANVIAATCAGKATAGGIFGVAQGMKQFPLSAPGEYWAHILATARDAEGHLWVSSMRHAGVVYPADTPIDAHGKKLYVEGTGWSARGETHREGVASSSEYESDKLEHVTFPWTQSDVLLIASDGGGANKIEPVLYWSPKGEDNWSSEYGGIGNSNLITRTSSGLSPHLFPEYITDRQYFYASAARPGFMPRFLVGESNIRAPYWSTSPNSFGGQIAASSNGDLVGDLYRLLGGVVRFDQGTPAYAGYLASAALLPRGTMNNRVVAPGAEDLTGSTGGRNRFFLVGYRPGMGVEQGSSWRPAIQVDPHVPATIHVDLMDPTGAVVRTWEGKAAGGTYSPAPVPPPPALPDPSAPPAYPLTTPGVYKYRLTGTWVDDVPGSATLGQTFTSTMPGLLGDVGEFYVYTKDCSDTVPPPCRPPGAPGLTFDLPNMSSVSATAPTVITGHSTHRGGKVRYAIIMPGAVLAQGDLDVGADGTFTLTLNPSALHAAAPIYDIASVTDRRPMLPGRVLHISFLSEETLQDGTKVWDFHRVVLRGSTLVSAPRGASGAAAAGDGHPAWIPR